MGQKVGKSQISCKSNIGKTSYYAKVEFIVISLLEETICIFFNSITIDNMVIKSYCTTTKGEANIGRTLKS